MRFRTFIDRPAPFVRLTGRFFSSACLIAITQLADTVAVLATNLRNLVNAPYYIASLELHWRWDSCFPRFPNRELFLTPENIEFHHFSLGRVALTWKFCRLVVPSTMAMCSY